MGTLENMGKKKEKQTEGENLDESEVSYEDKLAFCNIIAQPMASKKLAGRIYKLLKKAKAVGDKDFIYEGIKEVQQKIRRGKTGIVIFAGDISPIEVMCHLPAVCEEKEIPYIYTPSRQDLGTALGRKRGAIILLVREHADYKEAYDKVLEEINKVPKVL